MPRNFPVIWLLASFYLYDATLDDIVYVAVADGAVLTPPLINCAEDGMKQLSKLLVEVGRERSKKMLSVRGAPSAEPKL